MIKTKMAAPRPGNPDRGWNDPPLFDYQAAASVQSSPRCHLLNKRVAFPSSNQSPDLKGTAASSLNPGDGPPPIPVHILPPATNTATPAPVPVLIPSLAIATSPNDKSLPSVQNKHEDCQTLPEVLERLKVPDDAGLMNFVKQAFDAELLKCKDKLQSRVLDDVTRKLQLFTDMWSSGQLSEAVKCRMGEMAEEISTNQYEKAWSIHLGLMVDHTAEVNQWLVGIKRIIHELKENATVNIDSEKTKDEANVLMSPASNTDIQTEERTEDVDSMNNEAARQSESENEKEAEIGTQKEVVIKAISQKETESEQDENKHTD